MMRNPQFRAAGGGVLRVSVESSGVAAHLDIDFFNREAPGPAGTWTVDVVRTTTTRVSTRGINGSTAGGSKCAITTKSCSSYALYNF